MAKRRRKGGKGGAAALGELSSQQVEQRLLATSFPRLQMLLILSIAALGTFLSSASLVSFGVDRMWVRYGLAVLAGYAFFLSLVRVWIAYQTRHWSFGRERPEPVAGVSSIGDLDVPDLSVLGDLGGSAVDVFSGGGGGFGGGGAGGSFGLDGGSGDSGSSGLLDAAGSADEGLPILIAIAALLAGLVALGFVVYSSPILFAEVLLDVAVVGAVYKRNKRHQRSHWAAGVLRRTYKPALVLAVLASIFGLAMQSIAPEEQTLGAVLEAAQAE